MRIAQVSPLIESVPPQSYGGTERIVSYLTEELVAQGHEVTLFASGDSRTSAHLVPCSSRALRQLGHTNHVPAHLVMVDRVARRADEFDLLHFHTDNLHYPLVRRLGTPHVTTLHGRLDLPELAPLYAAFDDVPLISISDHQRTPLPAANWLGTVPHGLPEDLYALHPDPGDYLAFVGRFSPEKRVDRAIAIAGRAGLPLRIAAKIDPSERDYFETVVRPLLTSRVELLGEVGDDRKEELLGGALALLFPIDWPEPFGLVMIEALACGTPVIAFEAGSVPEIVEHGVTGFVVRDVDEAVEAVARVGSLDRRRCREAFERRFAATRMARDYLALYERLVLPRAVGAP